MSARENSIPVRLSDSEKKKLEEAAKDAGFKTVSEYVRYMTIGDGHAIREDVNKILKKLDKK